MTKKSQLLLRKLILIFAFICFGHFCYGQQNTPNDCVNAIKICGSGALSSNADGTGDFQEVSGANTCGGQENNSLWLRIEIENSGSLGFELRPTSAQIEVDYDFFIFGPNTDCSDLRNAIRCSTTNPIQAGLSSNFTGMKDMETDTSEGPGAAGNSYVKSLDVQQGEIYYVVIDRPIGSSPFELEWTGTATESGNPFSEGPVIHKPEDQFACNASGSANFDLGTLKDQINSEENIAITFHQSLADAVDNNNSLPENYRSTGRENTIYIRVENEITGCAVFEKFNLVIENGLPINTEATLEVCDLDFNNYVEFELNHAKPDILEDLKDEEFNISYHRTIAEARQAQNPLSEVYTSNGETVFMRVEDPFNQECFSLATVNLIMNSPPEINEINILQPKINANNNTLTIVLEESDSYAFSINKPEGPFQKSKTFKNIEAGIVTLYIQDANSCQIISTQIPVLGFNNFFTPNGDGYNDYWNIRGIIQPGTNVRIFDRFGKLLKELDAMERGWDGTYNGSDMPSDDYWFKITLENGRDFKGHFSLKRERK